METQGRSGLLPGPGGGDKGIWRGCHGVPVLCPTPPPAPQAYVLLGQFLVLRKDEELFQDWLKETCGANAKQSRDCAGCLREWCDAFL